MTRAVGLDSHYLQRAEGGAGKDVRSRCGKALKTNFGSCSYWRLDWQCRGPEGSTLVPHALSADGRTVVSLIIVHVAAPSLH